MYGFRNKTKSFFESKGWRISWSLFVIAIFVNLFVNTLQRSMDWFRVVLNLKQRTSKFPIYLPISRKYRKTLDPCFMHLMP